VQERDHLNNLLGSFIDKKRSGLRVDHDSYCSIDKITSLEAQKQNTREARSFIARKINGPSGIA